MDDIGWILLFVVAAFIGGAFLGIAAEKSYIREHCEKVQQIVVDDTTYSCKKV
jgi:hypothetical protein